MTLKPSIDTDHFDVTTENGTTGGAGAANVLSMVLKDTDAAATWTGNSGISAGTISIDPTIPSYEYDLTIANTTTRQKACYTCRCHHARGECAPFAAQAWVCRLGTAFSAPLYWGY